MRFYNLVSTHFFPQTLSYDEGFAIKKTFGEKKGKTLYVPKIRSKNGGMDFLRCYSEDDLASFPAGTWGIREPGDLWEGKNRSSSEFFGQPTSPPPKKKRKFSE
jgi:hypothetical protein